MQTQNALTAALVSAGFQAMPLNKRVWLWLRDHPGKTCREIAVAIGSDDRAASVALLDLCLRKMAHRRTVTRRLGRRGEARKVFEYETCISEYELLPLPAKKESGKQAMPTVASAMAAGLIKNSVAVAAPDVAHPAIDVKRLPLGEALRLYGELKVVFGGVE